MSAFPHSTPDEIIASLRADADGTQKLMDAFCLGGCEEYETQRIAMLRAAAKQIEDLRRWKAEALAVEAQWDAQAVGKALGLTLGTPIKAGILPAVEKLKAELASLRNARTET
jgi:hypothetical protein